MAGKKGEEVWRGGEGAGISSGAGGHGEAEMDPGVGGRHDSEQKEISVERVNAWM